MAEQFYSSKLPTDSAVTTTDQPPRVRRRATTELPKVTYFVLDVEYIENFIRYNDVIPYNSPRFKSFVNIGRHSFKRRGEQGLKPLPSEFDALVGLCKPNLTAYETWVRRSNVAEADATFDEVLQTSIDMYRCNGYLIFKCPFRQSFELNSKHVFKLMKAIAATDHVPNIRSCKSISYERYDNYDLYVVKFALK